MTTAAIFFAVLWMAELRQPEKEPWPERKILTHFIIVVVLAIGTHVLIATAIELAESAVSHGMNAITSGLRFIAAI